MLDEVLLNIYKKVMQKAKRMQKKQKKKKQRTRRESTQQTQPPIISIRDPYATRRRDHHTTRSVELPERRTLAAPSACARQLTGIALHKASYHTAMTLNKHNLTTFNVERKQGRK
jgi:hypothetical protein